jgi:hypothetical protein
MLRRYVRPFAFALALPLAFLASAASAAVLWDQSNWNKNNEGSVDLSSNSCSQISGNTKVHIANDVHFDTPVTITTVRIYETAGNVQAATQAYLWIAPKTGPVPTALASAVNNAANLKPITISSETVGSITAYVFTCSGLNISLPAGDYWVALTPRHSLGIFPYTVHLVTADPVVGDPAEALVACTENSNWAEPLAPAHYDYAMKIEGDQPVPAVNGSWGTIKALYR